MLTHEDERASALFLWMRRRRKKGNEEAEDDDDDGGSSVCNIQSQIEIVLIFRFSVVDSNVL